MAVSESAWTRCTEVKTFFALFWYTESVIGKLVTYNVFIKFTLNTKSVVLKAFYGMTPIWYLS